MPIYNWAIGAGQTYSPFTLDKINEALKDLDQGKVVRSLIYMKDDE